MLKQSMVEDKIALHNIRNFILCLKENGRKRVDAIQIMLHFSYPPEKIQKIMKALESEGLVEEE
ncbi:hypothetical protein HYU15_02645 [Candidatus Woesearchaeota archaeon]|nr:hypothetical protein [Candidatus Woesearchaeota archaeon]